MNRLAYHRAYMAGSMDRVPDGGVTWRQNLTPFLKSKRIIPLDPCNKPIDIGLEDESERVIINKFKAEGNYEEVANRKIIRAVDLHLVDHSDFIIVYLDLTVHPCGSYEELFWANRMKRPILVVMEQGKQNAPTWLFWCLPHQHIFSSFDELKEYISYVDSEATDDEIKLHNNTVRSRWMFFNWEELYSQLR